MRSQTLLAVRICFYTISFLHLLTVALILLNVDMSRDEDPAVRLYTVIRWRLLTIWCNLIALLYFPICIYCDWMEMTGQMNKRVQTLNKIRNVILTSILLPVTLYCDTLFWRTWHQDPGIIAPIGIFVYLPYWTHHSLHSISGLVVLLDILLVPRQRPSSLWPGANILTVFTLIYTLMVAVSYTNGIVVYAILNIFDRVRIVLLIVMSFLELYFFYTLQWCIIDAVWGREGKEPNKMKTGKEEGLNFKRSESLTIHKK